ncbi:MAG: hypothetical protein R3E01_03455 [Pirellulaceae bacterium]|nr:hypothetical protein [Planctomycetales bacterium]
MFIKQSRFAVLTILAIAGLSSTGCISRGPNLGIFAIPIPISPYFQDREEREFYEHERYERVPILGPITKGGPAIALDPPSDDQIMRAIEKLHPVSGGIPFFHEKQRNNVRIVKELIADYVDPPRVMPLVGPVQQHHAHYKCTVYYSETTRNGWPLPYTTVDEDSVEVVYIDHNHLHIVGDVDTGPSSNY